MRGINPREAGLLDAAAGAHIRFRLAGETFPPVIVYKIYVHTSIVDVGSFCPRDYATERSVGEAGAGQWYQRVERNSWRPVATSFMQVNSHTAIETEEIAKPFIYSRVVRQQDTLKRRKERRRAWLRKIYANGEHSPPDDEFHEDDEGERDIDDLLGWAKSLNFDTYHAEWRVLATTGRSEGTDTDTDNDYYYYNSLHCLMI